ncbi:MAG: hypothetical protein KAJ09_07620 [Deltaproteobacteria bacterium]|nr:hypothetical protein [Deltaproteobacteria bacterium]
MALGAIAGVGPWKQPQDSKNVYFIDTLTEEADAEKMAMEAINHAKLLTLSYRFIGENLQEMRCYGYSSFPRHDRFQQRLWLGFLNHFVLDK